jgi:hypothetical protein
MIDYLEQNLKDRKVMGVFNGTSYTGTVLESAIEANGEYNHIIILDKPIVRNYNSPYQTARNNRWVFKHINFRQSEEAQDNFMMVVTEGY